MTENRQNAIREIYTSKCRMKAIEGDWKAALTNKKEEFRARTDYYNSRFSRYIGKKIFVAF